MRLLLTLLSLLLGSAALSASPFPGGVLDTTGRTAYLAAGDSVAAVDLTTGEIAWRSDEVSEPLFVVGDRLYALAASRAGRLYVRGLDLRDRGQRVWESAPIELPRWAVPENGAGRSFSFRYTRDGSRLELSWQVAAWAALSPRKTAEGAAALDLQTGKVSALEYREPAPDKMPAVLEKLSVRWRSAAGPLRAVVLEEQAGSNEDQRRQALVFRTWNERGAAVASTELLVGREPLVLPDAAGGRLWLRDSTGAPDRNLEEEPRWLVVDASEGREIARVPFVPGTTAATIHADRAYFLTPGTVRLDGDGNPRRGRALTAVDLRTGKVVWKRSANIDR